MPEERAEYDRVVAWFVALTVLGGLTVYATHVAICALGGACP